MKKILLIAGVALLIVRCGSDPETISGTRLNASVGQAKITISDGPSFNFGVVRVGETSQAKTFTVTNSGSGVATSMAGGATGPFNFKGGRYPGIGGDCTDSLYPGLYCLVVVEHRPTSAGSSTGSLLIQYSDGRTTQATSQGLLGGAVGG